MNTAIFVRQFDRILLLSWVLRRIANRYSDGSVVTIRRGRAAGMRFKRFHGSHNAYWLGIHEIPTQEAPVRGLIPGQVIYDVGANAGFFSALISRIIGPAGHFYAFDPLPKNLVSLRAQVELNELANCTVVEAAVSDYEGTTELTQWGSTQTVQLVALGKHSDGLKFTAATIKLDNFAASNRWPDWVKIDVEGAEMIGIERGGAASDVPEGAAPNHRITRRRNGRRGI